MLNKRAVVTVCVGQKYQEIAELTHPILKAYADKIGCEFIVIDRNKEGSGHWAKFQLHDLLGKYDRIIYVDTDMIIRNDTPDLFDIVPEDKIGIFEEGRFISRSEYMKAGMNLYKMKFDWKGEYYNTGIMVLSRKHRYIFIEPSDEIKKSNKFYSGGMLYSFLGEQTLLNCIMQTNFDVEEDFYILSYKFNRMTCVDELTGEPRHASYIIHYAGCPGQEMLLDLVKKDLKQWECDSPNYKYKKNIIIDISGGLGDQICCEPIARYAINNIWPYDNIWIKTHWPELFSHLNVECVKHNHKFDLTQPYFMRYLYPDTNKSIWQILNNSLAHTTDFGSISTFRGIMPDKDKQIKIPITEKGEKEVLGVMGDKDPKDLILIHPGRSFDSKTFPVQWWDDIIAALTDMNFKIGIIGKHVSDSHGTLDVFTDDERIIDFRDALSIQGTMALISSARILITNDSAPVHMAGAFNNWIILIPTLKHPDHVLPYRHGYKYYKAIALYKKLTVDDSRIAPTNIDGINMDKVMENIYDYIPEVNLVVDKVIDILNGDYQWQEIEQNNKEELIYA